MKPRNTSFQVDRDGVREGKMEVTWNSDIERRMSRNTGCVEIDSRREKCKRDKVIERESVEKESEIEEERKREEENMRDRERPIKRERLQDREMERGQGVKVWCKH